MSEKHRKCVKCGVTAAQDPSLTFHRFPNIGKGRPETVLRARIWAEFCYASENCADEDFLRKLHISHKMLCSKHFSADSFMSKTRLNKFCIPIEMEPALQKHRVEDGSLLQVAPEPGTSHVHEMEKYSEECALVAPEPGTSHVHEMEDYSEECELVAPEPGTSHVHEMEKYSEECALVAPEPGTSHVHEMEKYSEECALVAPEPGTSHVHEMENYSEECAMVHKKRKNYILKPMGVQKLQDLTPRELKLYKICRKSLQKMCSYKQKWKQQKKTNIINKLADNDNIRKLFKYKISDSLAVLLQSQLKNCPKKPKGRRYNLDEQILALTLFKKSPACYRLLRRMFSLPCQSTLKKLLNKVPLMPGINSQMFSGLANMVQNNEDEDNICTLIFDEMGIQKNLAYNKKLDLIEGYQDHGRQGRCQNVATKALVFMLSGVRKKWKQPIAYYLSGNYTTADRLVALVKEVLEECVKVGVKIVGTVCDLSRVNIRALEILGATKEKPFFNFAHQEIVTILDPPHLLKCYRNLFMKHDVLCATDVHCNETPIIGTAKWSHIKTFYENDKMTPNFVCAPFLTDAHISPNNKQKMRVKLAAQIFSHSVAIGILTKTSSNDLPAEAVATANFLYNIDQLFDSLNADSKDLRHGKKYSTNMTRNSPHLEYFKIMKKFITEMKFVGSNLNPPSQEGWIRTMNAVERLWHNLNILGIKSLATRGRFRCRRFPT